MFRVVLMDIMMPIVDASVQTTEGKMHLQAR
jgi:hypothetical protein